MFATHHRPEDLEPRHPGDSAEHVGQLHVQQEQGFLSRLPMRRTGADEGVAMADGGPQGTHVFVGAKGAAQQPVRMERLPPWALSHVRLSARDMLQVSGIDDMHSKAAGFSDVIHRDPIHARRFHGHRGDPTGRQPVG